MSPLAIAIAIAAVATAAAACHASPAPSSGAATCDRVAGHVEELLPAGEHHGEHRHKVRAVLVAHCMADQWAVEVRACMLDEHDLHARHHCQDQLTAEQRTAFNRDLEAIDAPAPVATLGLPDFVPAECEAYGEAILALQPCDKVSSDMREALRKSFEILKDSLRDLPAEARPGLGPACEAGADAVRQALTVCTSP